MAPRGTRKCSPAGPVASPEQTGLVHVRVTDDLVDRVDRRGGDVGLVQQRQPVLARPVREGGLELGDQVVEVRRAAPGRSRSARRPAGPAGRPRRSGGPRTSPGDDRCTASGRPSPARSPIECDRRPREYGPSTSPDSAKVATLSADQAQGRGQHAHVEPERRPLVARGPGQPRDHRQSGVQSGERVGHRRPDRPRARQRREQAPQPRGRLHDRVVGRPGRVRAGRAEARSPSSRPAAGLRARTVASPTPSRSRVPGRKFSTRASASATRSRYAARPAGSRRSRATLRLEWLSAANCGRVRRADDVPPHRRNGSPLPGASTLTTSAPSCASSRPA